MRYKIATEVIDFQSGKFFKELAVIVEEIRLNYTGDISPKFSSHEFESLTKIIKKYVGLNICFDKGGPAIFLPKMGGSHVFYPNYVKELMQDFDDWDSYSDVRPILKAMDKKVIQGEVSLMDSKVSGFFSDIQLTMLMPREMFNKNSKYTSGEVAAIMLHEIGHAFTAMEFLSRTVTTNQVLAGMMRVLDKTVPQENREFIFTKGAEKLKMSNDQVKDLLKIKNKKVLTCLVLDASIQLSVSELGKSVYDANSCEQLADQFATRHGAGKDIVTSLDKLMKDGGAGWGAYGLLILFFVKACFDFGTLNALLLSAGLYFFAFILIIMLTNKESDIYDNPRARFDRIKMQNIEQLKDRDISDELKNNLIAANDAIDEIAQTYKDNLNWVEVVAYYTKPSYRNAHKYEILQKQLEAIGSSELFTSSAKLSTI